MDQPSAATELAELIKQFRSERQKHVHAIERIDTAFEQYGISAPTAPRRGRPPGRPPKATAPTGKRKRGTFRKTAQQFILGLLKKHGAMATAEINRRWKQAGRGATADTTLGGMVKAGAVRRENAEGKRGSVYSSG